LKENTQNRNHLKTAFNMLALATLVLYLALGGLTFAFYITIQHSRVSSCEKTYESIRDVFKPFFRPPDKQTAKEKADKIKFNRTINAKKASCDIQVSP
jgi:hypothetical protein